MMPNSQDKEDFHSHHYLTLGALVDGEEADPDTAEHEHAESQELGFIEYVRQIPGQKPYGQCS